MELDLSPGSVIAQSEAGGLQQFKTWLGKGVNTVLSLQWKCRKGKSGCGVSFQQEHWSLETKGHVLAIPSTILVLAGQSEAHKVIFKVGGNLSHTSRCCWRTLVGPLNMAAPCSVVTTGGISTQTPAQRANWSGQPRELRPSSATLTGSTLPLSFRERCNYLLLAATGWCFHSTWHLGGKSGKRQWPQTRGITETFTFFLF